MVSKIKDGKDDFGFNAKNEKYENMLKAGIIDPAKVVRVALENASSVAGMLLTTECVISEIPSKEDLYTSYGGGGMPGMTKNKKPNTNLFGFLITLSCKKLLFF